jgi:dihydrofolate reductase
MHVSLIVAASENNVIGRKNQLPWHLPDDLRYFRTKTKGKTVIMGRKTYESIGKPLPDRRNIVISTTKKSIAGCEVFSSLGDAFMKLHDDKVQDEVFIIGGAQLFHEALMEIMSEFSVKKLYLTRVHAEVEGDVVLPPFHEKHWKLVSSEEHAIDKEHAYAFTFEVYERV